MERRRIDSRFLYELRDRLEDVIDHLSSVEIRGSVDDRYFFKERVQELRKVSDEVFEAYLDELLKEARVA